MAKVVKKPAYNPKKGLPRLAKRPRGSPTLRRPCSKYTRHRSERGAVGAGRKDRMAYTHNLKKFYSDKGDKHVLRTMIADGMIVNTRCCPKCGRRRSGRGTELHPSTRCFSRSCRHRFIGWKPHPVLSFHGNAFSWADQAALLTMILQDVPNHLIHSLGGFQHTVIEQWKAKFRSHIRKFVDEHQNQIKFHIPGEWVDVEADEVTLGKRALTSSGRIVKWIQYIGLMRRGSPETLVLLQLPPRRTTSKAPGPGPLLKSVWSPIAEKFLRGQQVILHTDSAKAYLLPS